MPGFNADFNQNGDSVFENVYIYGDLIYDFESLQVKDLTVDRYSWHGGIATFKDDVFIEGTLNLDKLTVLQEFQVGAAGTLFTAKTTTTGANVGVSNQSPTEKFHVNSGDSSFVITGFGTVGVGTVVPAGDWIKGNALFSDGAQGKLKLDVSETIRIGRNIYDSVGSPGENDFWLKRDEYGIRWQPTPPSSDEEGIKLQDEGIYVPKTGIAQTFSTLNFVQRNSLGVGSDTLVPTAQNPTNATGLATIFTQDFWGYYGSGETAPIFRMTSVGIGTTIPAASARLTVLPTATGTGGLFSGSTSGDMLRITPTGTGLALNVDHAGIGSPFVIKGNAYGGVGTNDPLQPLHIGGGVNESSVVTKIGWVGIGITIPSYGLDVNREAYFREEVTVDKHTELNLTLNVDGAATFQDDVTINADGKTFKIQTNSSVNKFTVDTSTGNTLIEGTLDVNDVVNFNNATEASSSTNGGALTVDGGTGIAKKLFIGGNTKVESNTQATASDAAASLEVVGGVAIGKKLFVGEEAKVESSTQASSTTDAALVVTGGVGIGKSLHVGGILELDSNLKDVNNDIGVGVAKTDYRLASVGTGVSWRPSGVETKNTIWVSVNGLDTNSGLLEGDAKRTIGGAAAIAEPGDTIIVRSGVYKENNPVGLRTEVTVSGEDLRLVTVVPLNVEKDVFQVRAGCLVQNLNFAGSTGSTNHPRCGAVAFPPTAAGVAAGGDYQAVTGYTSLGPANQGPDRVDPSKGAKYRSPYVRNCTNFMTGSIGMKINGDYVNAAFTGTNDLGQDLKSMVCDSFTQYNENGIGVSLTNNAYAQLVSIFTIGCDVAISCSSGGQCDLTNSNSSFGNVGLKADGYGAIEFTSDTNEETNAESDTFVLNNVVDVQGNYRKPFDGQGAYFHLNLDDYGDSPATGIITQPLQLIRSLDVLDGGSGYNQGAPPVVTVDDPLGPESILPEFSANVSAAGTISSIDVIASGRNFLPNQDLTVTFSSGNATASVNTDPILYTVESATEPTPTSGLSTVTFNEFIPYSIGIGVSCELVRLSRIITSSHSFEYVGAGTDLNRANPFQGGEPIPENEIIAINGGQIPFTSTDQKGNFRIGDGITVDQTTSTIRGRDFNRAIQAQLTPLILSLR